MKWTSEYKYKPEFTEMFTRVQLAVIMTYNFVLLYTLYTYLLLNAELNKMNFVRINMN